jgi:hypothetical protein
MSRENEKKQAIDLITKAKILKDVDNGVDYNVIMAKYNLKARANISMIKKRRNKIEEALKTTSSPLKKTLKPTKYENIDKALKAFISNANNKGIMINANCLVIKAIEIANKYGFLDFKASHGYVANFKKRNIFFKKSYGVANSVPINTIQNLHTQLSEILENIDPKDVFNADVF